MTLPLTELDEDLLQTIVLSLRLFTRDILACLCSSRRSASTVDRFLARWLSARMVRSRTVFARQIPPISAPTFQWRPGEKPPDAGSISYTARTRFRSLETRQITIYLPTKRATERFGVTRSLAFKSTQASHDMGVARMFLYVHTHHPDWVERWRGEDCYAAMRGIGEKVEDAVILKPDSSEPELALEFLGSSYDKERLLALHHDLERRSLSYMWF